MKKVFVDVYLSFNFGDDLFLDILANKFPNTEFTVNYVGTNYDEFLRRYSNVNRRQYTFIHKLLQRFKIRDTLTDYKAIAKRNDALVMIGGSIFREEYFHQSLYEERLKMIHAFKKLNKPIYIIGANFGPVKTETFISDYRSLYQLCTDVCFRDQASYDLFKDMENIRLAPDVVFGLDITKYRQIKKQQRVGFSIIDVHHKDGLSQYEESYLQSTVKTICTLIQAGYECWLLSFCKNEGDLKTIELILERLPGEIRNKVKVYSYTGNIEELLELMATFKMCIAARFHANIVSLLLNVGIMPIIYSSKTTNMLKDIALDNLLIEMDQLSLMYRKETLNSAFDNKVEIQDIVLEAQHQFEKFSEFIQGEKEI